MTTSVRFEDDLESQVRYVALENVESSKWLGIPVALEVKFMKILL